ncbi:MAG: hypothetical protein AB7L90_03500 [Hyphomicrobiaceae bacterium]
MLKISLGAVIGAVATGGTAWAQTIYPLGRAEILAGSRFDFKVEIDGAVAGEPLTVTIGGRVMATALGLGMSQ